MGHTANAWRVVLHQLCLLLRNCSPHPRANWVRPLRLSLVFQQRSDFCQSSDPGDTGGTCGLGLQLHLVELTQSLLVAWVASIVCHNLWRINSVVILFSMIWDRVLSNHILVALIALVLGVYCLSKMLIFVGNRLSCVHIPLVSLLQLHVLELLHNIASKWLISALINTSTSYLVAWVVERLVLVALQTHWLVLVVVLQVWHVAHIWISQWNIQMSCLIHHLVVQWLKVGLQQRVVVDVSMQLTVGLRMVRHGSNTVAAISIWIESVRNVFAKCALLSKSVSASNIKNASRYSKFWSFETSDCGLVGSETAHS